ncbi:MAG: DNA replication complex subunit Gins51 [Candidatus Thorarchaeota archaeon]
MNNKKYENIRSVWEEETQSTILLDLDDLTIGQMSEYLAGVRLALTEVPAENVIQAELYTREIENIEYMLKDLLLFRREKILRAALEGRKPKGTMTLAEEEFYNRISRGIQGHSEFIEAILTGKPLTIHDESTSSSEDLIEEEEEMEYIAVRFTRPIDTPFMGLDEQTYGPFKKEDIATIPVVNAQAWLRDGTVIRVIIEKEDRE